MKKLILLLLFIPLVFSCSSSDEDESISGKKFLEKYNDVSWDNTGEGFIFYNSPKSFKTRLGDKCTTHIFGQDKEDMTFTTFTYYIIEESENSLKIRAQEYYNGDPRGSDSELIFSISDDGSKLIETYDFENNYTRSYRRNPNNICN